MDEEAERQRLGEGLRAEVAAGHPLFGVDVQTVGRSEARDDVLYRLADGRWALVHLTWHRPDRPPWPATKIFDSVTDAEAATSAD